MVFQLDFEGPFHDIKIRLEAPFILHMHRLFLYPGHSSI